MTSTPPSQLLLQTPPSPRHGPAYDTYEPYAPRKSTRSRRVAPARQITPEPIHNRGSPVKRTFNTSTSKGALTRLGISPPLSPDETPQKNSTKKSKVNAHTLTSDITIHDEYSSSAPSLGQPSLQPTTLLSGTTMAEGMLPTPVKTPRKKEVDVNQTARALFQNQPLSLDEVAPTPKKGRRSRKNFGVEDDASVAKIQIFTDSKDRLPEVDESEDNPFYIKPGRDVSSTAHTSKRRKISGEAKRDEDVEEHIRRNDGIVYVFRGKKIFRKFEDESEQFDPDVEAYLAEHPEVPRPRPLTRTSIKPRLLFPNEQQRRERDIRDAKDNTEPDPAAAEEEEADTDIEDENNYEGPTADEGDAYVRDTSPVHGQAQVTPGKPGNPIQVLDSGDTVLQKPSTGSTIKFHDSSASPPSPVHYTRSTAKKDVIPEEGPAEEINGKKNGQVSPFLSWKRTKTVKGKNKRTSDELADASEIGPSGPVAKKAKGH